MRSWLRAICDAIFGRIPGKTSRLDTATRMIDADFSPRGESRRPRRIHKYERDAHLINPIGCSDTALVEQLVRIVNEAQERDAEDERRLVFAARASRSRIHPDRDFRQA
jgi:hypothetical protein